jgi:Zn-finger nucleic acid-binding protein
MAMKCPVDNETLVMADRGGVEIDYCPRCRGVWLDRGELDKIIERAMGGAPAAPQPAAYQPPPPPQAAPPQPQGYPPQPQGYPPQGRPWGRDDDDDDDRRGGYRKKRRESFLGELFVF